MRRYFEMDAAISLKEVAIGVGFHFKTLNVALLVQVQVLVQVLVLVAVVVGRLPCRRACTQVQVLTSGT